MSAPTIGERLATVEEQVNDIRKEQKDETEQLKILVLQIAELQRQLERYKGFLGGIVFVVTCVGTFLKTWPFISGFFNK